MIEAPDDYSWFSPGLADAYCFTYVRGLTPEEVVTRLGVKAAGSKARQLKEDR
ncbi:DUF6461 domain-containing protein [Nonomuraea wenchangensis]